MHRLFLVCSAILLSIGMLAPQSKGQDQSRRASPAAHADCHLANGKTVVVEYSSPRARGRKIFGGLVPYGEVWRAGANEATTFVINGDVSVVGTAVPAGAYTIFTIPNQDKWTLIISKTTKNDKGGPLWGTNYAGEGQDQARIDMKVSALPSAVDNFTISFDKSGNGCTMMLDWETTRASVVISPKK